MREGSDCLDCPERKKGGNKPTVGVHFVYGSCCEQLFAFPVASLTKNKRMCYNLERIFTLNLGMSLSLLPPFWR